MFAAFVLAESEQGRAALRAYFDRYVAMAVKHGTGFILESPTWRANPDWGAKLGYDRDRLAAHQPRRHRHDARDSRSPRDGPHAARRSAGRSDRAATATIPAR